MPQARPLYPKFVDPIEQGICICGKLEPKGSSAEILPKEETTYIWGYSYEGQKYYARIIGNREGKGVVQLEFARGGLFAKRPTRRGKKADADLFLCGLFGSKLDAQVCGTFRVPLKDIKDSAAMNAIRRSLGFKAPARLTMGRLEFSEGALQSIYWSEIKPEKALVVRVSVTRTMELGKNTIKDSLAVVRNVLRVLITGAADASK